MKVMVTGGAGYIGTELVFNLVKQPDVEEVIIYDNLSRANYNIFLGTTVYQYANDRHAKVTFVQGDLLDTRKLKQVLSNVHVVYHLAAKVSTPFVSLDGHGHIYEQNNHWGTAELVYAAEEYNIEKFVYLSSVSVYGLSHSDENSNLNPQTIYGITKQRGEDHVKRLANKMDTYIIRCGNVYGYNKSMRFDAVINRFMFEANFNDRISINGDGKQSRAFIHVKSVAYALTQLLDAGVPSDSYNLVEKNFQILDIVDIVKEIYPELEFLFVNQHMQLREITVDTNIKLDKYLKPGYRKTDKNAFKEELLEFKSHFAF